MIDKVKSYRSIAHYLVAAAFIVYGFLESNAGEALVKQYPHLAGLAGFLTFALGVYFNSKKKGTPSDTASSPTDPAPTPTTTKP